MLCVEKRKGSGKVIYKIEIKGKVGLQKGHKGRKTGLIWR